MRQRVFLLRRLRAWRRASRRRLTRRRGLWRRGRAQVGRRSCSGRSHGRGASANGFGGPRGAQCCSCSGARFAVELRGRARRLQRRHGRRKRRGRLFPALVTGEQRLELCRRWIVQRGQTRDERGPSCGRGRRLHTGGCVGGRGCTVDGRWRGRQCRGIRSGRHRRQLVAVRFAAAVYLKLLFATRAVQRREPATHTALVQPIRELQARRARRAAHLKRHPSILHPSAALASSPQTDAAKIRRFQSQTGQNASMNARRQA